MSVLKVRDKNGKFVDIPAIVGPQGPAVYKAGAGINISEDNVISATGGGTGGASYVAGTNISIEGNVISATIPEEYVTETELNTTLETKADKETTYTKTETDNLVATRVDKTYVDTQLNLKANKSTTYTKTETNTAIEEYIADKADKSYVDTQLVTKANVATTYTKEETDSLIDEVETSVNLTLNTKVNQGDVYTKNEIDEKLSGVTTDAASIEYVDNGLASKADKATTYTKTEVDNLIGSGPSVAGDTYPIGALAPFAGNVVPQNWLLCDGREVSRETYKELFAVIGTTYGAGDGSTSFNLPDSKDKTIFGVGDEITLGAIGGEKEHTLTVDEMPSHRHNMDEDAYGGGGFRNKLGVRRDGGGGTHSVPEYAQTDSFSTYAPQSTGGNKPHNNMPPYLAQTYIIKAKQSAGVVATVADTLESSSTTDALSANMGKTLYESLKNINNYSTDETVVGKWVDGKPLYRKIYISSTLPASDSLPSGVKNINDIISLKTLIKSSDEWREFPWLWVEGTSYGSATYSGGVFYNGRMNYISFQLGNAIKSNFQKYIITLEYTKTTD